MPPRLSVRQEQCVRLTAFRTDKEIAAHLGISEATVKKHVHEACRRLGVNRRKAALAILEQEGPGPPRDSAGEGAPLKPDFLTATAPDDNDLRSYRAPPRGPLFRLVVIALIAVVICLLLIAVLWMVGEVHHVVGRLDPQAS